jgi:hypothetical protein
MNRLICITSIFTLVVFSSIRAQNPFITHIFSADPSAHVWPGDTSTLWIYASHDTPGTNHHATMHGYRVFSTNDLVNWTDHGQVLSVDNVSWAAGYAWAIDAVYRHGKYYLIFCMYEQATSQFRTGIAVSDLPQGPFTDLGFIKGIEWGQDPAVFVDDDNRAYIYWGSGGDCYAAELNDDLLSIKTETFVTLTEQLDEVYEGPWVHKYQGRYYLSYPALTHGKWPQEMFYAVSTNPLGPYEVKGNYIPEFEGRSGTNHGSITKYNDKWIAFYHSAYISGVSESRCLMADWLQYNPDGTIIPITPSKLGISDGVKPVCRILLEAENGEASGGRIGGAIIADKTSGYSGRGYVTGFGLRHNHVEVLAQVREDMKANLKIRLWVESDCKLDVLTGPIMRDGWDGTPVNKTIGWEIVDFGEVQLFRGDNRIRVSAHQDANLKIDYFEILPMEMD